MTGFFDEGLAGALATWVAALLTIGVWAYLVGERRLFRLAQHLLAGLASGYLTVLAVREVLVPRLIDPLSTDPGGQLLLWPVLARVVAMAGARWLPRPVVAVPGAILVAGVAAFALGGAVVGTLLPQMAGALLLPGTAGPDELLPGAVQRRIVDQVDPVDHREAEAVEQDHAGQDHRVRVRQPPADCEVGERGQQCAAARNIRKHRRQPVADIEVDQCVRAEGDRQGEDHEHQFDTTPLARDDGDRKPGTRPNASPRKTSRRGR